MRPTKRHMAVAEYVTPDAFADFQKVRLDMPGWMSWLYIVGAARRVAH